MRKAEEKVWFWKDEWEETKKNHLFSNIFLWSPPHSWPEQKQIVLSMRTYRDMRTWEWTRWRIFLSPKTSGEGQSKDGRRKTVCWWHVVMGNHGDEQSYSTALLPLNGLSIFSCLRIMLKWISGNKWYSKAVQSWREKVSIINQDDEFWFWWQTR